jgi:hypothetical protein
MIEFKYNVKLTRLFCKIIVYEIFSRLDQKECLKYINRIDPP